MNAFIIFTSIYAYATILISQLEFVLTIRNSSNIDQGENILKSLLSIGLISIISLIPLYIFIKEKYKYYIYIFFVGVIGLCIDFLVRKQFPPFNSDYASFLITLIRMAFILIIYTNYLHTKK